jgi:hypothetical protein
MAMSVLSAPIYASSLIATLLRLPARFVVTPKSDAATRDRLITFRRHLQWSALLAVALVAAMLLGHANVDVMMWPAIALLVSLAPVAIWVAEGAAGHRTPTAAGEALPAHETEPAGVVAGPLDEPTTRLALPAPRLAEDKIGAVA